MAKECMLSTGKLPLEGIPRKSMVRITDYSDLIPAVYCGHKATNQLSRVVRKPAFCICENKDADQLRGNREADQRLCFRYTDSTILLLPKSEISNLLPSCVAVQVGLCRTWSETSKTGFLRTRLNLLCMLSNKSNKQWEDNGQSMIFNGKLIADLVPFQL